MTSIGRVLAFDPGDRRIGWAVSDPLGLFPENGGHLDRSGESWPWTAIGALVEEHEATLLVVGDPISMSGESGDASRAARSFATELARRTGRPVELQDERLTSVEAGRIVIENRGSRAKPTSREARKERKSEIDRVAASLILQTWLDRRSAASRRQSVKGPESGA